MLDWSYYFRRGSNPLQCGMLLAGFPQSFLQNQVIQRGPTPPLPPLPFAFPPRPFTPGSGPTIQFNSMPSRTDSFIGATRIESRGSSPLRKALLAWRLDCWKWLSTKTKIHDCSSTSVGRVTIALQLAESRLLEVTLTSVGRVTIARKGLERLENIRNRHNFLVWIRA